MIRVLSEKFKYKKLGWLHDILKFIGIVVILIVVFRFVIGFSVVDGKSMEPTLSNKAFVVYFRPAKNLKVGDIVSVWVPSGHYYVKRVVATGGDVVEVKNGSLYVNGVEEEPGDFVGDTEFESGPVIYPYLVSEDNYFLLGDNREESMDSRAFGEVSKLQIRGKVIFSFGGDK